MPPEGYESFEEYETTVELGTEEIRSRKDSLELHKRNFNWDRWMEICRATGSPYDAKVITIYFDKELTKVEEEEKTIL